MYKANVKIREEIKSDNSKNPVFFIANHLYKMFPVDTLVRIGMHTVFLKDKSNYDFGGNIIKETDEYTIFIAKPKRINIDNDNYNMMECITWERDDNLTKCLEARKHGVIFHFDHFEYKGKNYYELDDIDKIINLNLANI